MKNLLYIASIVLIPSLFSSCEGIWPNCLDGNGVVITQERTVGSFDRLESNGDFQVYVYPGDETLVEVEADENLMGHIVTRVYKDELIIENRHRDCLRSSGPVRITVTTPTLNSVELNGSGSIWCDSLTTDAFKADVDGSGSIQGVYLQASTLDAEMTGSGSIRMKGIFDRTDATIEGSGEIVLTGESLNTEYNITGSGKISGNNMLTSNCYVNISGSGDISTWVTDLLDVEISGSGNVYYYGEPPVINTHISGSGKVIKKDHN
jgi:hypothetical protein